MEWCVGMYLFIINLLLPAAIPPFILRGYAISVTFLSHKKIFQADSRMKNI